MRILLSIHHELNPNAGASGATLALAREFRAAGHGVDIISFNNVRGPEHLKRLVYPWFVAIYLLRNQSYDVADLSSGDGWVYALIARLLGRKRPLIVSRSHGLEHVVHDVMLEQTQTGAHNLSWFYPLYTGGYRLWECKTAFRRADLALFLNHFDLRYAIEKLGVNPSRAKIVRNGSASYFVEHAQKLLDTKDVDPLPRKVAFIGSFIDRKGIHILHEFMINLMRKHADVVLGFFGVGVPGDDVLKNYPDDLRDRMSVQPHYKNDELPVLLADYHLLAFPALSEGFSLAPPEAMACGLVPVVSDAPGVVESVQHQVNGLVVAPARAEGFEKAIESLLADPERWRQLRHEALKTAQSFQWSTIAKETVTLYQQGLKASRAA